MVKDYYLILGVPLDAAPDAIRSAFRKLALRYHPDRGEVHERHSFQELNEAYEILSDPARRARYDRERRLWEGRVSPASPSEHAVDPEPLVSEPVPLTGEAELVRPSYEALLDRILRNFAGEAASKAEQPEPLNFELILSTREAARGVVIPFEVPALSICDRCAGAGRTPRGVCGRCAGEGRVVNKRTLDLGIPPGVRDGDSIEVSLEPLGVENLWLRVLVRISEH
jgi:DnaJ-class molecular chaperone